MTLNRPIAPPSSMQRRLAQYTAEIEAGAAHQAAVKEMGKQRRRDHALTAALEQCWECAVVPCNRPFCLESHSCEDLGIERAHVIRAWYCHEL